MLPTVSWGSPRNRATDWAGGVEEETENIAVKSVLVSRNPVYQQMEAGWIELCNVAHGYKKLCVKLVQAESDLCIGAYILHYHNRLSSLSELCNVVTFKPQ